MLTLTPAAGEGGGCFYVPHGKRQRRPNGVGDPDRSRVEAARRARKRLRVYTAGNRLNRLGTLTYAGAGCHDPAQIRSDLGGFFRRLRDSLGGDPLPYAWVPEWHPGGHGLHAHFAVGRYVRHGLIKDAWGHGHVGIKLLGDLPVGSARLAEARRAARYLGKYVSKSFEDQTIPGRHRYEVAQGFQPERVRVHGRSPAEVIEQASAYFGGALPSRQWSSAEKEDWEGPPSYWAEWS